MESPWVRYVASARAANLPPRAPAFPDDIKSGRTIWSMHTKYPSQGSSFGSTLFVDNFHSLACDTQDYKYRVTSVLPFSRVWNSRKPSTGCRGKRDRCWNEHHVYQSQSLGAVHLVRKILILLSPFCFCPGFFLFVRKSSRLSVRLAAMSRLPVISR